MNTRPITEDDLTAYIDARLSDSRRAEVAAYLAAHPEVAARIAAQTRQRDMLREMLAPIAQEPVPADLDIRRMLADRRQDRGWPWRNIAAAALLVTAGMAVGWTMRGPAPSVPTASLGREAAASYLAYAPDLVRPVEIAAKDSTTLAAWAHKRIGRPIAIPDLAGLGYGFMGGRVVPTEAGPAAVFMYHDPDGARLVILARPVEAGDSPRMDPVTQGALNGFAWVANGVGYSIIGQQPSDMLHAIADEVRAQKHQPA